WSNLGTAIQRVPLAGGSPDLVFAGNVLGLAIDGDAIYETEWQAHGAVRKLSLAGAEVAVLAKDQPGPWDVAVGSGRAYFVNELERDRGPFGGVGGGGGGGAVIAADQAGPAGVAVDETGVYWIDYGSAPKAGSVNYASLDGAQQLTLVVDSEQPNAIAVGATA